MTHLLVLDSSVVGAITNPKQTSPIIRDCQIWFRRSLERQSIFVLPEIADYEIRRELLRGKKINGIKKLDGHLAQFVTASHWQDLPLDRE